MREPLASSTVALLLAISLVGGCRSHQPWGSAEDSAPVRLAKWKDGHRAAISVTYDNGDLLSDVQRAVRTRFSRSACASTSSWSGHISDGWSACGGSGARPGVLRSRCATREP
jgi:hypothetical protein